MLISSLSSLFFGRLFTQVVHFQFVYKFCPKIHLTNGFVAYSIDLWIPGQVPNGSITLQT